MISWLMWSTPRRSDGFDDVGPHDRVVRDPQRFRPGDVERHRVPVRREHLATEAVLPTPITARADGDAVAERPVEVLRLAQRPVRPRRRHLDAVVLEIRADLVRDALAERVVDTARMVDVDPE